VSKFLYRFFLIALISGISGIIFLTYYGIETDKFDSLIKNKANEVNKYVKLDFQKTKIHLNPKEFNLTVKLQNPKILIKKNEIVLSKLDLFLSIKSFFTSDFLLQRAEISFTKNNIKDLTKVTNIFLPKILNKQLDKVFRKGNLEGEFIIPFKNDGTVGKDYGFIGKVSDASIYFTKDFIIKNLTTDINHSRDVNEDQFDFTIQKGFIYDFDLSGSKINLKRYDNNIKNSSLIKTKGKLNSSQFKKISSLFLPNIKNLKNINGIIDLQTKINFNVNKNFKVKNLSYFTEGELTYLEISTKEKKVIKKYFEQFKSKVILKDTKVKINNLKNTLSTELEGLVNFGNNFDPFRLKNIYEFNNKKFNINGNVNLTNSAVKISRLNFNKKLKEQSEVNFDVNFVLNKYYNINALNFLANKTRIVLSDIKLNKNFSVDNFKKIEVKTFENGIINNDFLVKKSEKIVISGKIFDAQPLLKSFYKKDEKKTFSKNFTSKIKINFDKTLTGTNDDLFDLSMIASIKKGSYDKLSLKGIFSEKEIVEMSIYQVDNNKKTLQLISDRARPFIKNFEFIKGFEGGKLEYESLIEKKVSNSNLTISNFKVSKVPALAQLLTLASLQGIADTLSGEGIRFESFEMKSSVKDNILTIEDALAMGPAVSILLEGYIDKGKVVSLRGTLVPATKLNSIIASIPVVGDILVGKKTGEGVVGVSFKMKGPPKNIKTIVNPIKTLTPRFIVRALEKIKKQKKEKND